MSRRSVRGQTQRLTLSAMLLAVMLVLGWVEHMIPLGVSIPGIKLGLSNGVLIFAVYMLNVPTAFVLMVLKVVLSGLLFSGVSAMMYGLGGGLLSLGGMVLLSRFHRVPAPVVGVVGGMLHNVGQVALAVVIANLPFRVALGYMGWLCGIGAVCGFLTGTCAALVMRHMRAAGLRTQGNDVSKWASLCVVLVFVLFAAAMAWALYPHIAQPKPDSEIPVVTFGNDGSSSFEISMPGLP